MACEVDDRLNDRLKKRMEDIREIMIAKDPVEELNERTLALSVITTYKLEFSYGGPQDFFEFDYDPETRRLVEIRYYFIDLNSKDTIFIKEGTEEFKLLEELFYQTIMIE